MLEDNKNNELEKVKRNIQDAFDDFLRILGSSGRLSQIIDKHIEKRRQEFSLNLRFIELPKFPCYSKNIAEYEDEPGIYFEYPWNLILEIKFGNKKALAIC